MPWRRVHDAGARIELNVVRKHGGLKPVAQKRMLKNQPEIFDDLTARVRSKNFAGFDVLASGSNRVPKLLSEDIARRRPRPRRRRIDAQD